ncbi:hypothetical protein CDAR_407871 [Caerostris darwini]|uniref:Uncharacterized protein n=1 Tax=Caerostris darwini TaxID=1538125 RepID=A0AAV4NUE5_9ARAC|nr:hypothetical protein CDAR_407871 [Caerostris darwini]
MRHLKRKEGRLIYSTPRAFCPSLPSRKSPSYGLLPFPFTGPSPFSIMNDSEHHKRVYRALTNAESLTFETRHLKRKEDDLIYSTPRAFCPSRKSPSHGLLPSPFAGLLPFSIVNDSSHGVL